MNKKLNSNPVKTALTISMGFLLIFMLMGFRWAAWVSLGAGVTGLFFPVLSLWLEKAWMKLAQILSYIVPNIVMGIVFFCILLPVSLLSKVFRKQDSLRLKNVQGSVYKDQDRAYDASHFENMW